MVSALTPIVGTCSVVGSYLNLRMPKRFPNSREERQRSDTGGGSGVPDDRGVLRRRGAGRPAGFSLGFHPHAETARNLGRDARAVIARPILKPLLDVDGDVDADAFGSRVFRHWHTCTHNDAGRCEIGVNTLLFLRVKARPPTRYSGGLRLFSPTSSGVDLRLCRQPCNACAMRVFATCNLYGRLSHVRFAQKNYFSRTPKTAAPLRSSGLSTQSWWNYTRRPTDRHAAASRERRAVAGTSRPTPPAHVSRPAAEQHPNTCDDSETAKLHSHSHPLDGALARMNPSGAEARDEP
jgi:hypothetical protein